MATGAGEPEILSQCDMVLGGALLSLPGSQVTVSDSRECTALSPWAGSSSVAVSPVGVKASTLVSSVSLQGLSQAAGYSTVHCMVGLNPKSRRQGSAGKALVLQNGTSIQRILGMVVAESPGFLCFPVEASQELQAWALGSLLKQEGSLIRAQEAEEARAPWMSSGPLSASSGEQSMWEPAGCRKV